MMNGSSAVASERGQTGASPAPEVVVVPAGWFVMGSDRGRPDERPCHRVYLSGFAVARLPVTNREYARFVAAGGRPTRFLCDPRFNDPDQPVVGPRWADAAAYCAWLSAETQRRFRLPTEAEWECAALGGRDGRIYPWGNVVPEIRPGVSIADAPMDRPAVVGTAPASACGIGDMGWNVHEWCSDWYGAACYAESPERDPRGPAHGSRRSSRGGAWRHQVKVSRCAARSSIPPDLEYNDYGFRVFADVE
jgi:sulfatase modifying factor 1